MVQTKIIAAEDVATLIADEAVVTVSSSSGLGRSRCSMAAIGHHYKTHNHPRNITTIHPIAAGDMYGIEGIDHIAQPGPAPSGC